MRFKFFILICFIFTCSFIFPFSIVSAQGETPSTGPVYIVNSGDTLLGIANKFNINLDQLLTTNGLTADEFIYPGDRLTIPGLQDIVGVFKSYIIPIGETNRTLNRKLQFPVRQLDMINHLISPTEYYAGAELLIIDQPEKKPLETKFSINSTQSLLEASILYNTDYWEITQINHLSGNWTALPGDILFHTNTQIDSFPNLGAIDFNSLLISPLPLIQGKTAQIEIISNEIETLEGSLLGKKLHFSISEGNKFISLQGIHALSEPGIYPFRLDVQFKNGSTQSFEQNVLLQSGNYPSEQLYVDPNFIDPLITKPEDEFILSIINSYTAERYWNGQFISPATIYESTSYLTSKFGNRRTYYGIGTDLVIYGFHTGLDFGGGTGLPISAPEEGVVVFAGPLEVRGNATIIDHGWGVFSGFWHQSKIDVQQGDHVMPGQVVGFVGATGRVTGAHLHWELWVNGIQVNPMDWLDESYPRLME